MSDETLERLTEEVVRERTPIPGVPNNLEALLAAAKDAPLYYDDDPDNRAIKARQRLAAQARALAQEVLDLRGAGGALAEMAEYIVAPVRSQHMRDTTDDCDDARCIACDELADWDEALARWAELQPGALLPTAETEEEVRDDLIDSACRCCGVGIQVVPEDAVDLCLACLQGKGGDTNAPCKACKEPPR
ncbi:hypothetical protein LCGC14_2936740 [marine sediment metagenome]|uniref:Uncharacterized protein n=1 Tax=marine sediment metagenome TaxID=412755 RepID=A0A0F8ZRX8_9ZZZZ